MVMKTKYINPFTDFGFKKIFGEEASKYVLKDFLNTLLPEGNQIETLTFKNTEQFGVIAPERKAIFDVYCENEKGEKFIVELQKAKQNYFKDRTIFYSTFPIREQAEQGEWNFNLKAVYCVGVLDFTFDDYENEPERSEVVHTIKLKNQHGKVFYDKLTYIYLEMPNFTKDELELASRLDQWLYFIKNLEDFSVIPTLFKDEVFAKAFENAALSKMDESEMLHYERSLKDYRDMKGYIDTARGEGVLEGREEGRVEGREEGRVEGKLEGKIEEKKEIAKELIKFGFDNDAISKITKLNSDAIDKLRNE